MSQDEIDCKELVGVADRIGYKNPKKALYAAYIKSVITPIDLFSRVVSTKYILGTEGSKTASVVDDEPALGVTIAKTDKMLLLKVGGDVPEMVIKKGSSPCLYIPLRCIVGFDKAA
jgi:hypothetical protein